MTVARYLDSMTTPGGLPLRNIPITVNQHGAGLAALYTDETGTVAAPNPTHTDSIGNLTFFAVPGDYDIVGNGDTITVSLGVNGSAVLFGLSSNTPPGGAVAHFINGDLATATPLPSLFDSAPLGGIGATYGAQNLAKSGSTILVGTTPGAASFIGHPLNLIYRSTDRGRTWQGIATPWDTGMGSGNQQVLAIAFGADNLHAICTGSDQSNNQGMMKTTDGGLTWSNVTIPGSGLNGNVYSCAWANNLWWFANDNINGAGVGLYSSPDLVTWTSHTTGITGPEAVINITATSSVLLAGTSSAGSPVMARSTDNGATWSHPTISFTPASFTTDGSGNWLAWGPGTPSHAAQSLDNGATWTTGPTFPAFPTTFAFAFLPGVGWVSTWGPLEGMAGLSPFPGGGFIIYTAPVANPLVWTPTGYVPHNIYPPAGLLAI